MKRTVVVVMVMGAAFLGLALLGAGLGWWSDLLGKRGGSQASPPLQAESANEDSPGRPTLRGARKQPSEPTDAPVTALPPPVDLDAVDRDLDLHGIVVEEDGTPVGGAICQVVGYPWRRCSVLAHDDYDQEVLGPSTLTAGDGTFALRLRRGLGLELRVSRVGFATVRLVRRQPGDRVRVVLRPGVSLVVTALDPEGRPLEGVDLELVCSEWRGGLSFRREGRTDASGMYLFKDLPAGLTATLEANHGSLGGWTTEWEAVRLPASGETHHEVVVPSGRIVLGEITDARTGRPVEGARVGMGWTFFKETLTDEEGRYALGGWTGDGYHEINVCAQGYGRASRKVGQASTLDFALKEGFAVKGRVLGAGAGALAGAPVAVVGSVHRDGGQVISMANGETDAAGRFRLEDLHRDMPHLLVVMAEGFGRTILEFGPPDVGEEVVDLGDVRVPRGRLIAGMVLDEREEPLARLAVSLTGGNDDWGRLRPEGAEHSDSIYGRIEERYTDDRGRFAFTDLAPGHYVLSVERDGTPDVVTQVALPTGEDVTNVRIAFEPAREFRVEVLDERGEPVAGMPVYVDVLDRGAQTDASGIAAFRLPLDVLRVDVRLWDWQERPYIYPDTEGVDVTPGVLKVVLRDAALVRGCLLDPEGSPITRGTIRALRDGEGLATTTTEGNGGFVLRVPPGGAVDVEFRGDVWISVERRRLPLQALRRGVIPGGEEIVLRATPTPADRTITVRVVTEDGVPVPEATVSVSPRPAEGSGCGKTGADGTVTFDGLTAHAVTVFTAPPEGRETRLASATERSVVPDGRTITICLLAPLRLEGIAVDSDGRSLPGVYILMPRRFAGAMPEATTDEEGRFTLYLPPDTEGPLSLRAWIELQNGQTLSAKIGGIDLQEIPVRLVLRPHRGW